MGADTEGQWEPVPAGFKIPIANATLYDPFDRTRTVTDTRGLFVVHAALLYTGKILCFCGHVEDMFYAPIAYLYDPRVSASTPLKACPMPASVDLFCCHYVQLYDGRLLVIGGSQQDDLSSGAAVYHGSEGAKTVVVFDPAPGKENFVPTTLGQLAQGRWYPTVVMMGDGRAIVLSGRRESGNYPGNPAGIADAVEAISPKADSRATLGIPSGGTPAPRLPIYPGAHLAPDGNIYTTHTTWGQEVAEPSSFKLAVTATASTWTAQTTNAPVQKEREEGMSVPLPVTKPRAASQGRYLIVGGGQAQGRNINTAATGPILQVGGPSAADFTGHPGTVNLKAAEILDTTVNPPTWTATPGAGLTSARVNGHCVLLPDATVAVLGGHNAYKWQAKANNPGVTEQTTAPSLTVELFKPGVGFTVGAAMTFPRMYHSAALLLPDGRVWIAGGADPNEHEPWLTYPAGWKGRFYGSLGVPPALPPLPRKNGMDTRVANRKDYEIYKPPYLCKGLAQPKITGMGSGQVVYGGTFIVTTPQAASIAHVAIMRPGCVTHHTDTEQRYIELDFAPPSGNDITVTMVPATDSNLAPPGYYMVWIIDNQGIPCERARFIQVIHPPPWPNPPPPPPPATSSSWPCIVATVSTGSENDPDVVFLRAARDELDAAGGLARWFVRSVNRTYYTFSPQLAHWIARRPRWRAAMRDVVVRPGTRCIRAARRWADALPARIRTPALIAMLLAQGMLGLLALPIVISLVAAHVLLRGDHG